MNETPGNGADKTADKTADEAPQAPQAPLIVNGQYVKDLSFESPNAPGILGDLQGKQPDVTVNVDVRAGKIEGQGVDNLFEVVLDVKSELKLEGTVGFIAELQYAGIFTLNVPEEHISALLLIECPRLLFPFARNILADVTRDGGFVPMFLQPLDFAAMYQANLENQAQELDQDVAKLVAEESDGKGKNKSKSKA